MSWNYSKNYCMSNSPSSQFGENEKCYVYNISTTFLQQILSGKLLLVVIVEAKK